MFHPPLILTYYILSSVLFCFLLHLATPSLRSPNLSHCVTSPRRLRDLSHFTPLPSLERLYLGMNRVQEFSELDKLFSLTRLIEFSIISNPVS